jgi:hypothetical protein
VGLARCNTEGRKDMERNCEELDGRQISEDAWLSDNLRKWKCLRKKNKRRYESLLNLIISYVMKIIPTLTYEK